METKEQLSLGFSPPETDSAQDTGDPEESSDFLLNQLEECRSGPHGVCKDTSVIFICRIMIMNYLCLFIVHPQTYLQLSGPWL